VEREREIEAFSGSANFKITAEFNANDQILKAELPQRFDSEPKAKQFLESLIGASFEVSNVVTSPGVRNPSAPFTTSTLQQEANSRLGFSAKATMASAQKLYQEGKITYMRTDSVTLSGQAIAAATEHIKTQFGSEYSNVRTFKTKSANAQEAHEAIRPTNIALEHASSNEYDQKLYNLIRSRTLASQMSPAKLEKTVITISIAPSARSSSNTDTRLTEQKYVLEAKGEVIVFDGFLKVYGGSKTDAEIMPEVKAGDMLDFISASARQTFDRPPARYSEGALVKKLEDLGIGRPSTYATIINTVQVRGYAQKGEGEGTARDVIVLNLVNDQVTKNIIEEKTGSDKGKLVPTPVGEVVSDFLADHFESIVDYAFTAHVEEEFDLIANSKLKRNSMLDKFYRPFHKLIDKSDSLKRSDSTKSRELGIDPKSGKIILARFGRFGPMLQLGHSDDKSDKDEKPEFAPMPAGKKIETITFEEALHAFELPRLVGQTTDGQDIKANIGRFGPYIQVDKLFVSIKPLDPHTITPNEALELYEAKLTAEREKNIADLGDNIKVLNGRFGPYVTDGHKNVKIPKDVKPQSITATEAKKMLAAAPTGKKRSFRGAARKTTKK
jgi:DNA topoisomerase-1